MVTSTNPKLHSTDPPRWAPFRGVSLLYDAPGCAEVSGLERLERSPTRRDPDDHRLLHRLRSVALYLADTARSVGVDIALLPWRTYHVTLCDGVNDGDRARLPDGIARKVGSFLDALPDALLWSSELSRLLAADEVCRQVRSQPVTFAVDRVAVRGRAVVAELAPVEEGGSRAAMAQHERARDAFLERLGSQLGIELRTEWRPHVTLGYVADDDAARRLGGLAPRWRAAVDTWTAGAEVTFRSAAPYGFTDMVRFWRWGG